MITTQCNYLNKEEKERKGRERKKSRRHNTILGRKSNTVGK